MQSNLPGNFLPSNQARLFFSTFRNEETEVKFLKVRVRDVKFDVYLQNVIIFTVYSRILHLRKTKTEADYERL